MANINNPVQVALEQNIIGEADGLTIQDLLMLAGAEKERSLAIVLIAMCGALNNGSLCIKLELGEIKNILETSDIGYEEHEIERAIKDIKLGKYASIVSDELDLKYTPLVLAGNENNLYFQKYYARSKALDRKLKAIIDNCGINKGASSGLKAVIDDVFTSAEKQQEGLNAESQILQKYAAILSLLNNFVIISGGPGSGKTYLIYNILRCLLRTGVSPERIFLTAPTGRAAKRMSDAVLQGHNSIQNRTGKDELLKEIQTYTIHRLLRYRPSRNDFIYGPGNLLPADVVIVDEVSMADVVMMSFLMEAIPVTSKIILIGDPDQLPSVDAGALMARFIPSRRQTLNTPEMSRIMRGYFPGNEMKIIENNIATVSPGPVEPWADKVVFLKGSRRSSRDILAVAAKVNGGDQSVVSEIISLNTTNGNERKIQEMNNIPEGVYSINPNDMDQEGEACKYIAKEHIQKNLNWWTRQRYFKNESTMFNDIFSIIAEEIDVNNPNLETIRASYEHMNRSKILTLVRNGEYGCVSINQEVQRIFQHEIRRRHNMPYEKPQGPFAGMPIIITQNDYQRELFNGDIGIVLNTTGGGLRAYFPNNDVFVSFPVSQLPHYETAFAITAHKSQGSEYDNIMLIMPPDERCPLLTREILYTGITRARKTVIIYGSPQIIKYAIGRKMIRNSGPNFWLDSVSV